MTFRGYGIGGHGESFTCDWCEHHIEDGDFVSAKIVLRGYPIDGDFCLECAGAIFEEELIELGEGLQSLAPVTPSILQAAE